MTDLESLTASGRQRLVKTIIAWSDEHEWKSTICSAGTWLQLL
jgi:hypothetical protein